MSQENVALVRENFAVFDRRDRAAFFAIRDPGCEVIPDDRWPETGVISGRKAIWNFYVSIAETFGMDSADVEIVDAGADKVVVHRAAQARGRASGATVEFGYSCVVTVREGKIICDRWFADRAEALQAAELLP